MAEKQATHTAVDTHSNTVRLGYIVLALVLGVIVFLIIPAEALNSTGKVNVGLSYQVGVPSAASAFRVLPRTLRCP